MTTICGHERETLRLALDDAEAHPEFASDFAQLPWSEDPNKKNSWHDALKDIHDPAKLAEMLASEGRRLGLLIQLRLLVQDGEWPDFEILYFPNQYAPSVQPKLGFYARPDGANWDISMPQARALLLNWLDLPDGAREEAEKAKEWANDK